jgi:alpha-N-arabinofuranosidase
VAEYADPAMPVTMKGNLFIRGAVPHDQEVSPSLAHDVWPDLTPVMKADGVSIEWISRPEWQEAARTLVTTELLGKAGVSGARFENADGSPLKVDADYFGKRRNPDHPSPGPFESPGTGLLTLKVWEWKGE